MNDDHYFDAMRYATAYASGNTNPDPINWDINRGIYIGNNTIIPQPNVGVPIHRKTQAVYLYGAEIDRLEDNVDEVINLGQL